MFNASNSVRIFMFNVAIIIMISIWLSGFDIVHWFSYVLPSLLVIAAVTGYCPSMMISKKVLATLGFKE